ncbi:glycoside hydrolase family 95 protein [Granulicella arctica]|uniref:glycoside hydrolase family 95 protein n=1 Tax=Granulicella arctica TaxID=940613 RepID=UPI0021E092BC|nr:glycoside hydrolase family 95 protein [Granulicella arctica]
MTTSRRNFVLGSAAIAACPPRFGKAAIAAKSVPSEFWYSKPATRWMEALPLGNGRIGAMIYGELDAERIDLTESTVWSGAPSNANVSPSGLENLAAIRALEFAGRYGEAARLCQEHLLGRAESFGTHLPMATLQVALEGQAAVENYRRSLNLSDAIADVQYVQDRRMFRREFFSSNPADVLVAHLTCDRPKSMSGVISFAPLILPGAVSSPVSNTLVLKGRALEHLHSNGQQGVSFETRVRLLADGGQIATDGSVLHFKNADSITLLIAIATNYRRADVSTRCEKTLDDCRGMTFKRLRAAHIADHRALFNRVTIDLGTNPRAEMKPTDQRRKAVQAGEVDPGLSALFFQYGRYLTIAGSRHTSPLPLALQGIWNDGLASSMGWTDDFHLDINTQQNYWLAEVGNLSECQTPLFDFVDNLRVAGRTTARELYGMPGWVCHVVTNPWGFTAPGWGLGWGLFVTAGLWISLQLWEHYRFSLDKDFLRQRLYPILKEAAEFFLAYMVVHPRHGWLVTGPSVSPENSFIAPDGEHCSESMGPTCDRVLVFSLLTNYLEASIVLDIDHEFQAKVKTVRDSLPPLQIGKHGQLQEWLEDFDEAQPGHRHTSHLIALYPEHQISISATPALAKAARVTIERRITQPDWEDSEWSRANLINYYARLLNGNAAHQQLLGLIAHATEDSLLTYSRGGVAGATSNIFSLDGNTAGAAGIAEMLLQSHAGEIHLLPALPATWPSGSIRGLRARGGIEVAIVWAKGKMITASLTSTRNQNCLVRYGSGTASIKLPRGYSMDLYPDQFRTH